MPQAQFLDIPNWGDALGQFGAQAFGGYQEAQQADALQQLLSQTQGMEPDDAIQAIFGAKNVPFEQKQTVASFKQKAAERAEDKRKRAEEQKLKKAENAEKFEQSKELERLKSGYRKEEEKLKAGGRSEIEDKKIQGRMDALEKQIQQKQKTLDFQREKHRDESESKRLKRQFDEMKFGKEFGLDEQKFGFEQQKFGRTQDFAEKRADVSDLQFDVTQDFKERELEQRAALQEKQLEVQRDRLDIDRERLANDAEYRRDKMAQERELADARMKFERDKFESELNDFEKEIAREYGKEVAASGKELARLNASSKTIDELESLLPAISGVKGYLNIEDRANFDAKASLAIEPALKIFNPSGPIPQQKLKWVEGKLMPSSWDTNYTNRGKIQALRDLNANQKRRYEERMELIRQYNGMPPASLLQAHDAETEAMNDRIVGWDKEQMIRQSEIPESLKAIDGSKIKKPIQGPDGEKYKWVDGKWQRI